MLYFKNDRNDILILFFAAKLTTTTLADAPIIVAFPPRQAPKDKLHHNIDELILIL